MYSSTMVVVLSEQDPRKEGVTLLEIVFALVILTILTLSSLLIVIPVSKQVRISREVELANTETQKVLEHIQTTPFFQITTDYPDGTEITVPGLDNGRITLTYADPTADPLIVTASLTWNSGDLGNMSRTFLAVRTE